MFCTSFGKAHFNSVFCLISWMKELNPEIFSEWIWSGVICAFLKKDKSPERFRFNWTWFPCQKKEGNWLNLWFVINSNWFDIMQWRFTPDLTNLVLFFKRARKGVWYLGMMSNQDVCGLNLRYIVIVCHLSNWLQLQLLSSPRKFSSEKLEAARKGTEGAFHMIYVFRPRCFNW